MCLFLFDESHNYCLFFIHISFYYVLIWTSRYFDHYLHRLTKRLDFGSSLKKVERWVFFSNKKFAFEPQPARW